MAVEKAGMPDFNSVKKPLVFVLAALTLSSLPLGADNDKLCFNKALEKKEEKLSSVPKPKSEDPVLQGMLDRVAGNAAASSGPTPSSETLVETALPAPQNDIMAAIEKASAAEPAVQLYSSLNPADLKMPSPSQMYTSYFKQASEMSRGSAEQKQQAVDLFARAIGLDSKKAMSDSLKLDDVAKALYAKAYASKAWPSIEQELKKEKSFIAKNWWWMVLLAGAAGYGVSQLIKKDVPDPVDGNYKTTLNFSVINHTKGELKTYTLQDIMTGSSVTINVSDLGVTGVDPNRMAIRGPVNNCVYIASTTTGSASFTVEKTRDKEFSSQYTIFVMNASNGTDYSLVDNNPFEPKLNCTASINYIRGPDLITGPEWVISNDNKTGAVDQLGAALVTPAITYGKFTKVDSGGNLKIYYSNEFTGGRNGYKNGMWYAAINPTNTVDTEIRRVWIEEIFEATTNLDDLGGPSSHVTITNIDANFNTKGQELYCYVFAIDKAKIGVTSTGNAQAMSVPTLTGNVGDASFSVNPKTGSMGADYNGKNFRGGVRHSRQGTDVTAAAEFEKFAAGIGISSAQGSTTWTASTRADLEKAVVAMSGMYNTATKANSMHLSIANKPKGNTPHLQGGYSRQSNRAGVLQILQAKAEIKSVRGMLIVSGDYSSAEGITKVEQLTVGTVAQLDFDQFGALYVGGSIQRKRFGNILLDSGSLRIQKPIGPAAIDLSWNSLTGFSAQAGLIISLH